MAKGTKLIVGNGVVCPKHDGLVEKFETVISKLDGLKEQISSQFNYMDEKTTNAKSDMERRLEGMNEFRTQLAKQAAEFITRQEIVLMFEKQGVRIDGLTEKLDASRQTAATASGGRIWSEKVTMVLLALGSSMATGVMVLVAHAIFKF
jgi:hypothetical protein